MPPSHATGIGTGSNLDTPNRMRFESEEFYLKSPQEMAALFAELPQALANTVAVAEQCDVKFEFGKYLLPRFELPPGHTAGSYLRQLCEERLPRRYPDATGEILRQMNYELEMIDRMGFSGYLLIVWDFCDFARRSGIPVGPGRGSAAGCLVSYVLGITNIDPLRYKLVFERFLNPERVEMPDIDIDFCFERRGEVIEYVARRYGADCVAQIAAFGTMGARAVIRDVGRTLGMAPSETDRIAKLVPEGVDVALADALQPGAELSDLAQRDGRVRELVDVAKLLEGTPRHASVHAAGVVIAPQPLAEIVPLMRTKDGRPAIQFDMDQCKKLGLLKMDFLGLRNLTVIEDCRRRVEARRGTPLDVDDLPLDDEASFRMLSEGHTVGIFQFESSGMTDLVRKMRLSNIEDIIAASALFRPGPMENIPLYLKAKHGGSPVYPHPDLEPILRDTYGIMIYQEQVQQVAARMAGFSLGEADMLRRAIGKKDHELMEKYRVRFREGCVNNGHPADLASDLYAQIEKFAGYGFNKAHSAAYGYIAYQTAYLKANFPVEYMAALLTSMAGGKTNKKDSAALYIAEARRLGIAVLPPDVNESRADFTDLVEAPVQVAHPGTIRVGLGAVKNVGGAAVDAILAARTQGGAFRSLTDFCQRVDLKVCNRRSIESLIRAGAFDSLGAGRARLVAGLEDCMKAAQLRAREAARGQRSLFDLLGPGGPTAELDAADRLPDVPEFEPRDLLAQEKEVLGLYISGHPLEALVEDLRLRTHSVQSLRERADGDRCTVGGIVTSLRRTSTKKGDPMAFLAVEDLTGSVEVVLFPTLYGQLDKDLVAVDRMVLVRGKVSWRGERRPAEAEEGEDGGDGRGEVTLVADEVESFLDGPSAQVAAGMAADAFLRGERAPEADPVERPPSVAAGEPTPHPADRPLRVRVPTVVDQPGLDRLVAVLRAHPGPTPVEVLFEREGRALEVGAALRVDGGADLEREIAGIAFRRPES